jgi:hypothetical protein
VGGLWVFAYVFLSDGDAPKVHDGQTEVASCTPEEEAVCMRAEAREHEVVQDHNLKSTFL